MIDEVIDSQSESDGRGEPQSDSRIGIDLGRHRSFCALRENDSSRLVPLSDKHDGLVLRWLSEHGTERVTERLLRLSGVDQDKAIETSTAAAEAVFPELKDGQTLATSPWIAIPASFGPSCRAAVADGMAAAGVPVTIGNLIDRPIAGLAGWLASAYNADSVPRGICLTVDNDGGQLSAAAADLDQRRLLFSVPLSIGPDDDIAEVEIRFRLLVDEAHRLRSTSVIDEATVADSTQKPIEHVILTGSAAQRPEFLQLVERVLPETTMLGVRSKNDQAHTVVFGLLNLDTLSNFSACWPTGTIYLNDAPVRTPGPVQGDDITLLSPAGARLSFSGPQGRPLEVEVGSIRSAGVVLPTELGLTPRLRVLSDGRILVLGREGVRPLSMRVRWPVPSISAETLPVEAVGRRPLQLTEPRVALRRRATVGS